MWFAFRVSFLLFALFPILFVIFLCLAFNIIPCCSWSFVLPAKWFRFCTRDICNFECDSSIYRYINDIISFMGCTVISFVCVYHLDWTDLRAKHEDRDRNSERESVSAGFVLHVFVDMLSKWFYFELNWIELMAYWMGRYFCGVVLKIFNRLKR